MQALNSRSRCSRRPRPCLPQRNAPRDVVDEPQEEVTPQLCLQKMQSPSRNERWRYARLYANLADLGNVPNTSEAVAAVTPHLVEMLENHDEHTTSDAEAGVARLWDLGVRNDDIKGSIARCLNRAREKLASLKAAFAPIQNQAVPERVTLQSQIQDYTSLVETMEDYLSREWVVAQQAPSPAFSPSQGRAGFAAPFPVAVASKVGGFPKWLVAPLIVVAVAGVIGTKLLRKSKPSTTTTTSASAAAARSSGPSASAATGTGAANGAASTAASAPAAASSAKAPPKKKRK